MIIFFANSWNVQIYWRNQRTHSCEKAINPKDGTIFNFIIYLSNNKSKVIKNSFLTVSKSEVKRCNDINSKIIKVEFELIEKLLEEASIEGFNLSFPLEQSFYIFSLKCITLSYYLLCDQEHTNKNAYII